MGSKAGTLKVAAARCGLTVDEYRAKREAGFKRCTRCKEWRPVGHFNVDRSRGDGLTADCRDCHFSRLTSGPGKLERQQQIANGLTWCRGCEDWKPLAEVHAGLCRFHRNEYARLRYANDPMVRAERTQHAHSRKRSLDPIPAWKQAELLEAFGGRCAYCTNEANTWDHLDPVSLGGLTINGNVVPCCRSCNSSKKAMGREAWLDTREGSLNPALADILPLEHWPA